MKQGGAGTGLGLRRFLGMDRFYVAVVLVCVGLIMTRLSMVMSEPSPVLLALGVSN